MRHPSPRGTLFLLFAVSGFSGLVYESVWTQYLKLFLGHAAYAQTLVLAIFMGGMAIGSWLASRRSGRWVNVLGAYSIAELLVGGFALLFHDVFASATELSYSRILPRLGSVAAVVVFKWALSAALILPQSVLLGMTFPLMSAGVLRAFPDRPGRSLAMLYFTNSLGAVVGVLVSGFVLVRATGLPGTMRIAGFLNLAVAAAVWPLSRRAAAPVRAERAPSARSSDRGYAFLLAVSLGTGASSFAYEVGWIRMLSLVLGSSTHAFELMLGAFILGLALGGLWIERRIDRLRHPVRTLGYVQVAMGLLALGTIPVYGSAFEVMGAVVRGLPRTDLGYALFNASSSAIAIAVMLPAAFCAGMTLPLITYRLIREGYGERCIGTVYASNTVGAIVAVFLAIHLGIPLLGLKGLIAAGVTVDIGLGIALLRSRSAGFSSWRVPAAAAAAGTVAIAFTALVVKLDPYKMASGVYRNGELRNRDTCQLEYHRDGKTATVSVTSNAQGARSIATNGKVDAQMMMAAGSPPVMDEPTMILLGALPMAVHPEAKKAACIGMGSGLTSHTLLSNPGLQQVDTIEIEEEMVKAAQLFRPRNELVYTDPRSHVFIDDAKTFFSARNEKYDLIVSEPSNPWVSGVAGLFSQEFYRHVRRHLEDGAIFVQWVQLYEIDVDLVMSILKALDGSFSDFTVYAANDVDAVIVARNGGAVGLPDDALFRVPALAEMLRRIDVASAQDLEVRIAGTKKTWGNLIRSYPIRANSDYDPVLDQNAAAARFLDANAHSLLAFTRTPFAAHEMLSATEPRWEATSVTPSRLFEGSRRAATAMVLRDFVLRGARSPWFDALDPRLRERAARIGPSSRACGDGPGQERPVETLLGVLQEMIPNLTRRELQPVWSALEAKPCFASLSGYDRGWYEFMKAVGSRDGAGMERSARTLLASAQGASTEGVKYLIAAGMLGALARGDEPAARELSATPGATVDGTGDLLLRLLVAESRRPHRADAYQQLESVATPKNRSGNDHSEVVPSTESRAMTRQ